MSIDFCAFGDTEDDRMVRDAARGLLAAHWPSAQAVALAEQPAALTGMWNQAAGLGWTAVGVDTDPLGGLPAGLVLLQELGRAGCPLPLMDAMLANAALAASGDAVATTLRSRLHSGELRPTWAWNADAGESDALALRVSPARAPACLEGHAAFVEHAAMATHVLLPASDSDGLIVVPLDAPGVSVRATPGLNAPALSEIALEGVKRFERLRTPRTMAALVPLARLLLAARALGAAACGLELLTDYVKVRSQFGRKIGQYQAIQHKLADCFLRVEICRLAVQRAGRCAPDLRAHAAAVAAANAGHLLRQTALELMHGFGGIAFWEAHEMPRLFRRIHGDLTRLGGAHAAREALAATLLDAPPGTCLPEPDLGEAANGFRREVRDWLAAHWDHRYPPETEGLPVNHRKARQSFSRKLGEKGWLGASWPREYGGQQRSALEQLVLEEEMAYAEAPVTFHNTAANMIGPALIKHGSPAQKAHFLPGIACGDISFALGYSEPDHGSDLAGLRTAAMRTGDGGWTVRGQKTFTSTAGFSTHLWLAARTDPSSPRAGGISVFIVPLDASGITMQPMIGLNGHRANTLFLDDVRLPADALVGRENGGWAVITDALAYERASLAGIAARARGYFDQLVEHLRTARRGGRPMARDALVRDRIGALAAEIEAARLLALQTAEAMQRGEVPVYQAAMSKVYGSELMERLAQSAFDLLGTGASLQPGPASALIDGRFEYAVRDALLYTIGGGTNEIQRTLIALRGLDLPR